MNAHFVPPLPPADILGFMGEDAAKSELNGELLLGLADGRWPSQNGLVLDIGCGYGRLAYALARRGFEGRYIGIDVTKRWVDWLQQHFTPASPRYEFQWQDVINLHYNPLGRSDRVQLPTEAAQADLVPILSVFTHMNAEDIGRYLKALGSSIGPHTLVYATFFTLNDEQRRLESEGKSAFPMQTQYAPHSRIFRPADPLYAIGHDEAWIRAAIAEAGLKVEEAVFGRWCGRPDSPSYQDSYFLRRA